MIDIELLSEIHSNTRRTRITYQGSIDGHLVAIKCYRRPLFGLFHWLRAQRCGRRIRKVGAPVPPIIYSGWVASCRCFGFATAYLTDYRPLREVLRETTTDLEQREWIRILGQAIADLHMRGIEQPDGNLTNFLVNDRGRIAMVDEDDVRLYPKSPPVGVEISNLANIAARVPTGSAAETLLEAYLERRSERADRQWDTTTFWGEVSRWNALFEAKRARRNIDVEREFD